jgi:hypothetical protein
MANQITHIVLAQKAYATFFERFDLQEFLIGTVFPDIRYFAGIERAKSHTYQPSMDTVLNAENSFLAGLEYHSLVDKIRESYMVSHGAYKLLPKSKFLGETLKCLEDELLYLHVKDWKEVASCFDTVLSYEHQFGIAPEVVRSWHAILQNYFVAPPTDQTRKEFMLSRGNSEEVADQINGYIADSRKKEKLLLIISDFYRHWDGIMCFPQIYRGGSKPALLQG